MSLITSSTTRNDFLEISLERAGFNTDQLSEAAFDKSLRLIQENYPQMASRTFVYVPNIDNLPYYGVFDFNRQTAQDSYDRVSEWAETNQPLSIQDYLEQ